MELLNDMALFVEVVKAKGFRGAAEAMDMSNSTLSRRIGALEKAIGLRLLHRTTRKVELTEAGQIYYERCKRIVDEAKLAHEELGEMLAHPTGLLRASFPVDFAVTYLSPAIAEFARRYPGIRFDFDFTSRRVSLVSEPFDVAIRIGESEDSQLIARPIATLRSNLYAAPAYLASAPPLVDAADLEQHECLATHPSGWNLQDGAQTVKVAAAGRFALNSVGVARRLAALGVGVVLLPQEIVADEVANGALVRVLPLWQGAPSTIYAMTETRLLPAKTQRFIEFLKEWLAQPRP